MNTTSHPEELLPWYVNGTLSDEEMNIVRAHLSVCDSCRRETEFLTMLGNEARVPVDTAVLDLARRRFMQKIKSDASPRKHSQWWRPAFAAAAVLVIVFQFMIIINYETGTSEYQPAGVDYAGVVYQISFQEGALEQDIRRFLQSADATIIDGPGSLGIYRIRAKDNERVMEAVKSGEAIIQHIERE